ncbi:MAG TPA: putative Ig domain-containing protein [Steroidobacteraceae bacterium]
MFSFDIAAAHLPHGRLRAITSVALLSMPCFAATAAPSISGTPPATVVAAHYFAFQPQLGNPGGKAVHFSIVNKPAWAQFDTTTGRLAGTPLPQANVGTFANILVGVSDGGPFAILPPFSITVLPLPNIPPRLGGTPAAAVVAGHPYTFQPVATDPNGLRIAFSIANAPAWASFNAATGLLSGTPTAGNVGTYPNIVITAYDGYAKATLPAFNIAVSSSATSPLQPAAPPSVGAGSATLSWIPPTRNTDGSVLTGLAGYRIYYGSTPDLGSSLTVANAGLTRYVVSGLQRATWYFAMTAYDKNGRESDRTEVASIAITQ